MEDLSKRLTKKQINDVAASFQKAAFDTLIAKTKKAVEEYKPKMLIIGGGVIANKTLRNKLDETLKEFNIPIVYPTPIWLCTDNAVMIAMASYYMIKEKDFVNNIDTLDRVPSLSL